MVDKLPNHARTGLLRLDAETYATDPAWWHEQARLASCDLNVNRGPGRGNSTVYADGGYDHVCTRTDLAGK